MHRALALALLATVPAFAQQPTTATEAPKAQVPAPAAEVPKKDAAPAPAAEAPKKDAVPAPAAEAPKKDAAPAPAADAAKKAPPAAAAPAPSQEPTVKPVVKPEPPPAHGTPAMLLQGAPSEQDRVRGLAKLFFQNLLRADAHAAVELSAFPFLLEGRRFESAEALIDEWVKHLRTKRTDLITLYGIDVYTPEQMEQKYGKPPARLSNLPLHSGGKTYVVVANLSGHAAVAIYREVNGNFRAVAYTD